MDKNSLIASLIAWRDQGNLVKVMFWIGYVLVVARDMVVRTLVIAAGLFLYRFYEATPETTAYQLAQWLHSHWQWQVAIMLACVYTAIVESIVGGFQYGRRHLL